jgi:hypothetical protein
MPTVIFSLDPDDSDFVLVASPYEAKDIIKSFPQRRWDRDLKVWIIPRHHEASAKSILIDAGFRVKGLTRVELDLLAAEREITVLKQELKHARQNQTMRHYSGGDPFSDLNRMVPENLRGSLYKALIRVLHPDMGGSTELAQMLNKSSLAKNRAKV